jgi:opacity protein-like surface antigen
MQKTLLGIVTSAAIFCSASFASGGLVQPMPVAPTHPAGWIIGLDGGYSEINSMDSDLLPNFRPYSFTAFNDHLAFHPNYSQDHDMGDFMWGLHLGRDFNITDNFLLGFEVGYKDFGKNTYDESFNPVVDYENHRHFEGDLVDQSITHYDIDYDRDNQYRGHQNWNVKVEQQAVDFLLTAKYYVWQGLNLNAKGGLAYVHSKTTSDFGIGYGYDEHATVSGSYTDEEGTHQINSVLDDEHVADKTIATNNWDQDQWRLEPEFALGLGYSFTPNIDATVWYDYIHGTDGNEQNNVSGENFGIQNESAHSYSINSVLLSLSYKFTT